MAEDEVRTAHDIARAAHLGQKDKSGLPYFETHVLDVHRRVVAAGGSPRQEVAALLHDVLEDTGVTEAVLVEHGVSPAALEVVRLLTRTAGQSSEAYLAGIAAHPEARLVKLADVASNTDPERLSRLAPATRRELLDKYIGYRRTLGEDAADLEALLRGTPEQETDEERLARQDAVLDDRMAARLELMEEHDDDDIASWQQLRERLGLPT